MDTTQIAATEATRRWEIALARELEEYAERNPTSRVAMERLCKSMPGGDTRSSVWFGPYPLVIDHSAGQCLLRKSTATATSTS